MIELYQAEWCPFSHQVRQRLTELMVPFIAHQVEPEPHERDAMAGATGGARTIPVLILEDGTVLGGDTEEILDALDRLYEENDFTVAHHERRVEAHLFER